MATAAERALVLTDEARMHVMTPREIVSELDRYIIGQRKAKRAVAIALRNRWRRQQVPEELRDEIAPKNILMIGPTGVGKTEPARHLGLPDAGRSDHDDVLRRDLVAQLLGHLLAAPAIAQR